MVRKLLVVMLAWLGSVSCLSAADPPPLGINLAGVSYWSSELAFKDLFKTASPWISQREGQPWGRGEPHPLRMDGYPERILPGHWLDSLLLVVEGHYPAGDYVCLWDGSGELEFTFGAKVASQEPGRAELVFNGKDQVGVRLKKTDPENPVRNIRVVRKEFLESYESQPFDPDFLQRWSGMKVIRFMDWMRTNGSPVREWSDRPRVDQQTQATDQGVALEYMIALANELKADPWFCMPHLASDDYIRQFATQVKRDLQPNRKIYIEYSNECWNGQFAQARHCREQGKELNLSQNDYEAQLRYVAVRSLEIFRIWEEVFGSQDRLVRVLPAQSANPWTGTTVMDWQDAYQSADAIAIAPYFGNSLGDPKRADEVSRMSVEEVLAACEKEIERNAATVAKYAEEARKRNLKLMAYEGGQHLVGHGGAENNQALEKLFHAANRHPGMKELYLKDLANWQAAGGDVFCIFSSVGRYSKWGSWGLLEYADQPLDAAPKYQAVQEFLKK